MGYYINEDSKGNPLPPVGKFTYLIEDGGIPISGKEFVENMVCIVNNGPFEAAGYLFNQREYEAFANPHDLRPKRYIVHEKAKQLSGYPH